MEKWLLNEIKYQAKMDLMEKDRKRHLIVRKCSELNVPNPAEIKSLSFGEMVECIEGDISNLLSRFTNLKKISFTYQFKHKINPQLLNMWLSVLPSIEELSFSSISNNSITWNDLKRLNLSKIKSLYVSMEDTSHPISIYAPKLEEFTIYGSSNVELSLIEKRCLKRNKFDFSGMPSLKKVKLSYCDFWDYSSLSCLNKLESIHIVDRNLDNIFWLSSNYSLSKLIVFGSLESLSGINTQPNLIH